MGNVYCCKCKVRLTTFNSLGPSYCVACVDDGERELLVQQREDLRAELQQARAECEQIIKERDEAQSLMESIPTWGRYPWHEVPLTVGRKLDEYSQQMLSLVRELQQARADRDKWKDLAEKWAQAADDAQRPEKFYEDYNEATMRAMQALLTQARERVAELQQARADLADIRAQLHGHPDSVLTGENGLAAATYRQAILFERAMGRVMELERALHDTVDAMQLWGSWEGGVPEAGLDDFGFVGAAYDRGCELLGLQAWQSHIRCAPTTTEPVPAVVPFNYPAGPDVPVPSTFFARCRECDKPLREYPGEIVTDTLCSACWEAQGAEPAPSVVCLTCLGDGFYKATGADDEPCLACNGTGKSGGE